MVEYLCWLSFCSIHDNNMNIKIYRLLDRVDFTHILGAGNTALQYSCALLHEVCSNLINA